MSIYLKPLADLSAGFLKKIDGINKIACTAPQIINVQLAPCQKPLTRKIIKILRMVFHLLPLLPPSGMYI
nr:hypothetical protein [uncultured bacterium]